MTPDEFDKRWVDRMLGQAQDDGATHEGRADGRRGGPDGGRAPAHRAPRPTRSILAALIRGLDKVTDLKTAELVLSRLSVDSDLVRETVVMLLSKTEAPEVIAWLRTDGARRPRPAGAGRTSRASSAT